MSGHELADQIAYLHYPLGKGRKHERYMLRKLASTLIRNWLEDRAQELMFNHARDNQGINDFRRILGLSDPARECEHEHSSTCFDGTKIYCKKCIPKEAPMQQVWCPDIELYGLFDLFYRYKADLSYSIKDQEKFCKYCAAPRPAPRKSLVLWEILYNTPWKGSYVAAYLQMSVDMAKAQANAALEAVLEVVDKTPIGTILYTNWSYKINSEDAAELVRDDLKKRLSDLKGAE